MLTSTRAPTNIAGADLIGIVILCFAVPKLMAEEGEGGIPQGSGGIP